MRFAGLPEAGGIEGGWGLLRCFVQLEQVYWLRATRPVCRTTEEERPVRNRLGQVGGAAVHTVCKLASCDARAKGVRVKDISHVPANISHNLTGQGSGAGRHRGVHFGFLLPFFVMIYLYLYFPFHDVGGLRQTHI